MCLQASRASPRELTGIPLESSVVGEQQQPLGHVVQPGQSACMLEVRDAESSLSIAHANAPSYTTQLPPLGRQQVKHSPSPRWVVRRRQDLLRFVQHHHGRLFLRLSFAYIRIHNIQIKQDLLRRGPEPVANKCARARKEATRRRARDALRTSTTLPSTATTSAAFTRVLQSTTTFPLTWTRASRTRRAASLREQRPDAEIRLASTSPFAGTLLAPASKDSSTAFIMSGRLLQCTKIDDR